MKKVLITGGSGTVGSAFIKEFYNQYQFVSYGRNKEKQAALKQQFSKVELCEGSIEDRENLLKVFSRVKPDIVIHTAALKQIEVGEKHPAQAIKTNLLGSLNIIDASKIANVAITIGISSDKACLSNSVYGKTKNLMERIFLEADDEKNRFVSCRLSNVAGSHNSVIPFWLNLVKSNQPLKITDPKMNRFMFLPKDAAKLIQKAIETLNTEKSAFVVTQNIKAVNMLDMAKQLSSQVKIVGKRPGEKLNETLIAHDEVPFTYFDGKYIFIKPIKNVLKKNRLQKQLNSLKAEKLNSAEIKNLIQNVRQLHECTD